MKAYINGRILNGDGRVAEGMALVVQQGKIHSVSALQDVPSEAERIDVTGCVLTPGLIDVHTHLGVHEEGIGKPGADFNETSDPITPSVRSLDGINPADEGFYNARKHGVTTVQVLPGSANVIGGEMCTVKTEGTLTDEMAITSPSGLKGALGENPKRVYGDQGKKPVTRMGIAALMRETFVEADHYRNQLAQGQDVQRDLHMEHVVKVLNHEIPLRVHAHRADDIATALRIKDEFQIPMTLEHGTEAHKIADRVAKSGVSVSVGPTMTPKSKVELSDKTWDTLRVLDELGVNIAITTDHPVISIENFVTSAATAVKHGLAEDIAWRAVTHQAAVHLGLGDRLGLLQAGREADFVIWDGHPLDYRTSVKETYIDGNCVYQA
ncbi:imidazolonepropionase-like amidohydrolase [Salsuginibacillus halophilus]|uniref:Imidazolonepropionase-like amidohydrolase n=1 Tax=Salsuginibacillus halophilus TaxID=517424 RepID=A0A2P8HXG5_9BACI|nr:amidohydrolase [Salsuginibacillus halophilus]PSL50874.1 imidazolonepropionase-like amidohydrolase [Salsuginibacillus halophilus]